MCKWCRVASRRNAARGLQLSLTSVSSSRWCSTRAIRHLKVSSHPASSNVSLWSGYFAGTMAFFFGPSRTCMYGTLGNPRRLTMTLYPCHLDALTTSLSKQLHGKRWEHKAISALQRRSEIRPVNRINDNHCSPYKRIASIEEAAFHAFFRRSSRDIFEPT